MFTRFVSLCLLSALLVALAGCGGSGGSGGVAGNTSTGISGTAQITISGGAVIAGEPTSTTHPLANAVITVQPQGGGTEITRALTGPNGEFSIALLPGTYRVVPLVSAADQRTGTTAQSQDVTVSAGGYTTIIVQYTLNAP
jgi:hypothetical protein